jgi:hypothetical protein
MTARAFTGGLVVICIKRLQTSEPTRVIMFYYAFWNAVIAAVPAAIWWVTPNAYELAILALVGLLGISGQAMITHGLSQAMRHWRCSTIAHSISIIRCCKSRP